MLLMAFTGCSNNGDAPDEDNKKTINHVEDDIDNDEDKDTKKTEGTSEDAEDKKEEVEENNSEDVDEYIPNFIHEGEPIGYTQYNFNAADLYVKAPAYHQVSHGLENFHYGMDLTIGYYAGRDWDMEEQNIEIVSDIMDNYSDRLIRGTKRYVYGDFESFEFDSIEEMTINDIDMIRYEGNMIVNRKRVDDDNQKKRYVVAYTFIHNGTPNAIFGVVGAPVQDQDIIETLIHNVDESVKTIVPKNP